jgi:hypothetical protein
MVESQSKYYQAMVEEKTFSVAWEFAPGRGAIERDQERLIASTESAALPRQSGGERGGQRSIHSVELWTGGGIRWPWPNF